LFRRTKFILKNLTEKLNRCGFYKQFHNVSTCASPVTCYTSTSFLGFAQSTFVVKLPSKTQGIYHWLCEEGVHGHFRLSAKHASNWESKLDVR